MIVKRIISSKIAKYFFGNAFLSICLFVLVTTPNTSYSENQIPNIVTTTGMITDIVKQVAGDFANVQGIIHEGVDPHLFRLTRSDMAKLIKADVIFYNGLFLEGKMTEVFNKLLTANRVVIALGEQINQSELIRSSESSNHIDPHIWMSPVLWSKVVEVIRAKLCELYPPNQASFNSNASELQLKIKKLDEYARNAILTLPTNSRVLVTGHDAFRYFGNSYELEVIGIQGLNTESETSIRNIERIVNILVDKKIKAIFVETTVSSSSVEAIVEGAAAKGHVVKIGGKLFSDAMGKAGTDEGTYIGMLNHNINAIVSALGQ